MTVSLKHTFQSAKADSSDVTIVQPSNWNEEHELTLATNKVLGRATAGTGAAEELSIGTALSISGGTLAVTTVPVANGGTGTNTLTANNVLLGNGTSAVQTVAPGASGNVLVSNGTTWTSAVPSSPVNYPQNSQSADYTLVLGDAGKQIFHPASDANVRTFTIPANASVAFPIGTVVLFTVENFGTQVNVAITSDTLINGSGVTGTQAVLPNNTLMCIKVTATKWMANYLYQQDIRSNFQIALAHVNTPFVSAYPWASDATFGFGAKYTNPATLPAGDGYSIAFSPVGNSVAIGHQSSPYIAAYPWSAAGFGVKYTNPATLPGTLGWGVAFSPTGDAIAVAHATTPFISVYPWNSSTGFGTKYAAPNPAEDQRYVLKNPTPNAFVNETASPLGEKATPVASKVMFGDGFAYLVPKPVLPDHGYADAYGAVTWPTIIVFPAG